ncbi:class C sortase [Bifidobacterium amazonense]|uniref:Class C sortase n=1 Tax=Bifidobacterium amazonense TaxID=2809027 RepID=A0ABS9VU08_9BIFI|nr:class C sortase [Bifidobacterium amazonense]MCH9275562.1 class C sortase [Bifidobacterium amazonense]MCH9275563.1 class C sortase [Bifidobacterium amazonense]
MAARGRKRRPIDIISTIISVFFAVVLVVGIGLLAYPSVADWWNRMHQSRAVATYIEQTEDLSKAKKQEMLKAAREYNAKLPSIADRWRLTDEQKKEYESILDVSGTGIMGYVTIPKLKVRFPVYHGTDEGVLQIAIGHLEGSSLPVGGVTTHAVVSGHTGLPSAKLLTGLDTLVKGDTFAFHVLDETYTYQVDKISVVLPNELDNLNIEDGKDYATVVTCTPYGVNTHRLLVRGHRIPNPKVPDTTDYDTPVRTYTTAIVSVAATVFILGIIIVRWLVVRRRRPHGGHSTGITGKPAKSNAANATTGNINTSANTSADIMQYDDPNIAADSTNPNITQRNTTNANIEDDWTSFFDEPR